MRVCARACARAQTHMLTRSPPIRHSRSCSCMHMQKGGGGEGDRDVRRKGAHTFVCARTDQRGYGCGRRRCIHMYEDTHTYICMYADSLCIYVYMYTHTHTHTRTHTHTHTHTHTDHGGYGYGRRSCISQTRTLLSADPWYTFCLRV